MIYYAGIRMTVEDLHIQAITQDTLHCILTDNSSPSHSWIAWLTCMHRRTRYSYVQC